MADEKSPASGAAAPGQPERRRPAPTIDLRATEIAGETAAESASGPAPGVAGASAGRRSMAWLPAHIFWPLLGAVVAGALLTLGVVSLVDLVAGAGRDAPANDSRLAQLEQQVDKLAQAPPPATSDVEAIGALSGRLQKLEAAVAALPVPAADPALGNELAAAQAQLKSLTDTVAALGPRAEANAAALAALARQLAQPDSSGGAPDLQTSALISALSDRVAALETGAKTLDHSLQTDLAERAKASPDDRPARAAAVALALTIAVERGRPFGAELDAAKLLAPDPAFLAPLDAFAASGVPTPPVLDRELSKLEPALLLAAAPAAHDRGILEKLQANAEKLIRIRPIDEVPGDDPVSVIARVEVRSMRGDLPGALAELIKLPADVRAPAQAWIAKAQARTAAIEATRRFAADTLAALGKPSP